jgi:hypothetical protein
MEIGINLYRSHEDVRQGIQFDVALLMSRLFQAFPGIVFEDEYFEQQISRVKEVVALHGSGGGAVKIAQNDANERGPRYGFWVPSPSRRQ